MAIKRIEISNFKSFSSTAIDIGKLNILIGANSSGKSNFIEIFRFIRDIATYGLVDAISLQGGIEYLRNAKIGSTEPLKLRVVADQHYGLTLLARKRPTLTRVEAIETDYEFWVEFKKPMTHHGCFIIILTTINVF